MHDDLPNIDPALLDLPDLAKLGLPDGPAHKPRILLLYGSNRERSYSRLLVQEGAAAGAFRCRDAHLQSIRIATAGRCT